MEQRIRSEVTLNELMTGLAEEAAELAQAALKYRRALYQTSPTPVSEDSAHERLLEEIADVNLYLRVLGLNQKYIKEIEDRKLERWAKRLGVQTDA